MSINIRNLRTFSQGASLQRVGTISTVGTTTTAVTGASGLHAGVGTVVAVDPGLIGLLGNIGTTPPQQLPPVSVPPQGGAPPPGVDLTAIVSAIPVAQDGQLITSAHHNIMRSSLLAIAAHLGGGGAGLEITTTVPPAFYPLSTGTPPVALPAWVLSPGIAQDPAPPTGATAIDAGGWIPVNLTDGAHIESMRALGSRSGGIGSLEFDLLRVPFDAHQVPVVIRIAGDGTSDPFAGPVQFDQTGLTSAVIQESTLVDNTRYLYAIQAIGRNITAAATVTIRGFQITCTLS